MNKEDVLRMAAKSNIALYGLGLPREKFISHLETFAKLVAQHERDACAKIGDDHPSWSSRMYSATIRARGQA